MCRFLHAVAGSGNGFRLRFNIRFNDQHSRAALRVLIEARANKAAGDRIRWRIEWEPSNADAFLTVPGPLPRA